MFGGFFQSLPVREMGIGRVIETRGSGIVPQPQDAAHGHIDPTTGEVIILPAIKEQVDDLPVNLHRGDTGIVVDGFQIVDAVVVVVNVEKLMVNEQFVMDGLGGGLEGFLAGGDAADISDGIEERQKGCLILLAGGGFAMAAAGQQQHQGQQPGKSSLFHRFRRWPWRSEPGSRRWRW